MEEKKPLIYSAICGVMKDVGVVGKGDTNKQQGFKYRSIDAVMNALNPAMIKNGVFCTPEVLDLQREERTTKSGARSIYSICKIRYRFYAEDGSFVDSVIVSEGADSMDKATNKALSAGFKYACFQTFCIPTEELMEDSDRNAPEEVAERNASNRNSTTPRQQSKPQQQQKPDMRPITESMLKTLCNEMDRVGMSMESMLKWAKIESLDKMPMCVYLKAMESMKERPSVPPKAPTDEKNPDIPDNYEGLPFV